MLEEKKGSANKSGLRSIENTGKKARFAQRDNDFE